MPKNKKKFIDRKNAITFHLVHRSQQDPLVTDEKAPQHVLVPQDSKTTEVLKEEQKKYGIYFDDDYNYLQHLRERKCAINDWEQTTTQPSNKSNLKLPSSVFASEVEEDIGLLNKAAPQSGLRLDLDPDVIAAMDEDFDFDDPSNVLEDDFVAMADGVASDNEYDEEFDENMSERDWGSDGGLDSGDDGVKSNNEEEGQFSDFEKEETRSRFTQYSMTSSVIKRNDQLTLLDDKFEQMYASYDDNEIGALDCEEIEGTVDMESELIKQVAEEYERENAKEELKTDRKMVTFLDVSSDEDSEFDKISVEEKEQWDCESILSTRSNLYNHPKLIVEPSKIKVDRRGVPVLGQKLTAKALVSLGADCKPSSGPGSLASAVSLLSIRSKNETPEERKERKKALKRHRMERREERKINTIAFKEEKRKMEKIMINNKKNLQKSIV